MFAGGDVIRPHLLTTAIGHGSIAADGIHNFLNGHDGEASQDRRAPVRPDAQDVERAEIKETHEPLQALDSSNVAVQLRQPFDRYIIPHDKLFLGHFSYVPRNQRNIVTLDKESAPNASRSDWVCSTEKQAWQAKLHELRHVLRMRQLRGVLPQTAVYRVKKTRQRPDAMWIPITTSASAAISAQMCARRDTFKWAWVNRTQPRILRMDTDEAC